VQQLETDRIEIDFLLTPTDIECVQVVFEIAEFQFPAIPAAAARGQYIET
jgi:hypothetical protein